jgi:hypothetical protein
MGWNAKRAIAEAAEAVANLAWVMTVATTGTGMNMVSFEDTLDTVEDLERQWSRVPIAHR